ncbi:hypothetical protein Bbelb_382580 [Branchiostoma belcheri]|nr:hypothetical protein Bbelb_382580 [Branchiostoma belcheri]
MDPWDCVRCVSPTTATAETAIRSGLNLRFLLVCLTGSTSTSRSESESVSESVVNSTLLSCQAKAPGVILTAGYGLHVLLKAGPYPYTIALKLSCGGGQAGHTYGFPGSPQSGSSPDLCQTRNQNRRSTVNSSPVNKSIG